MPAVIEAQKLGKRYGAQVALAEVDLAIEPGITAILGANGSGKSTLFKLLLGLLRPDQGTCSMLGLDPWRDARSLRPRVGYMPEHEASLTGLTGIDHVMQLACLAGLPRREALRRAHEALDYVGLGEVRYRPQAEYSTGQKQRVKLAQALAHGPELLLLDEPTNGLDPRGRSEMLDMIRHLGVDCGATVVVNSHILHDLERIADRFIVLREGHLIARDDMRRFLDSGDGTWICEVVGDQAAWVAALEAVGLLLDHQTGRIRPTVAGSMAPRELCDAAFTAARQSACRIRRLEPHLPGLSQLFTAAPGMASP